MSDMLIQNSNSVQKNLLVESLFLDCFGYRARSTTIIPIRTTVLVLILGCRSEAFQTGTVSLMVTVGEVESSDIHADIQHGFQLFDIPTGGSQRADNLGAARLFISLALDHVKADESSSEGRDVGCIRNHGVQLLELMLLLLLIQLLLKWCAAVLMRAVDANEI